MKAITLILKNCIATTVNIANHQQTGREEGAFVYMYGCTFGDIYISKSTTSIFKVDGANTNDCMISCPADFVYSIGDCIKLTKSSGDLERGYAIKSKGNREYLAEYVQFEKCTNVNEIFAILGEYFGEDGTHGSYLPLQFKDAGTYVVTATDKAGNEATRAFPMNYLITANSNTGSISTHTDWNGSGNTSTKQIVFNGVYGTLPSATKTGYAFKGWYKENTYCNNKLFNKFINC